MMVSYLERFRSVKNAPSFCSDALPDEERCARATGHVREIGRSECLSLNEVKFYLPRFLILMENNKAAAPPGCFMRRNKRLVNRFITIIHRLNDGGAISPMRC
jgi:hypothetical protein